MPTATKISNRKPDKPRKDFPLYAHRNGQWAKKIKGKTWFFGVWEEPEAALETFVDQKDEILAGRDPKRQRGVATPGSMTVADVVNHYLESLNARLVRGQVSARHFSDSVATGEFVVRHFGRRVEAAALKAADFADFRQAFPATWGTTKCGLEIQRTRTVFRWAAESELIPGIPNFGPDFKKPNKGETRITKAKKAAQNGSLDFTAAEVRKLVKNSDGWLNACILLGVNAGFGNLDCGRLQAGQIDFESGWYDLPRQKSGIPRRLFLWNKTRDAINEAMRERPIAKFDADDDLCFLTSHGRPIVWEAMHPERNTLSRCDNVCKGFNKLVKSSGLRTGRGFYSLRRTFETVAGNSKDQVAVNMVMGHADESMAEVYRQGIADKRLKHVAKHVEKWLFGKKVKLITHRSVGKS